MKIMSVNNKLTHQPVKTRPGHVPYVEKGYKKNICPAEHGTTQERVVSAVHGWEG